ncbi:ATP-binding protein [Streptomyces cavernae]|uniref:ATP-binding protein n=1 Tax=Streptomyces cavernae TaxID=2259034 RepID=UPI001391B8FA|nr:ATP-binding protein [Streptomyces cavernae]
MAPPSPLLPSDSSPLLPSDPPPLEKSPQPAGTFVLPAAPASVAVARRNVRALLGDWGVPEDVSDDALLVVSELVTNAIRYAGGDEIACTLRHSPQRLRIEVEDQIQGCTRPTRLCPSPDDQSGRGLLLVGGVSTDWGVRETAEGAGRVVWADLSTTEHPESDADAEPDARPAPASAVESAAEPDARPAPESAGEPESELFGVVPGVRVRESAQGSLPGAAAPAESSWPEPRAESSGAAVGAESSAEASRAVPPAAAVGGEGRSLEGEGLSAEGEGQSPDGKGQEGLPAHRGFVASVPAQVSRAARPLTTGTAPLLWPPAEVPVLRCPAEVPVLRPHAETPVRRPPAEEAVTHAHR